VSEPRPQIPPFLPQTLFTPLPGAKTRGVAVSEWESYRTDVDGKGIVVTTDDSNLFRSRNGKLNGNTGDTDASGLNVTDAKDSVILGSESADEAPWQTIAQAMVDIADGNTHDGESSDDEAADEDGDATVSDTVRAPTGVEPGGRAVDGVAPARRDSGFAALSTDAAPDPTPVHAGAAAAVATAPPADDGQDDNGDDNGDDSGDDGDSPDGDGVDFPYTDWTRQISADRASAVHTDDGTTLASGADALVIGGDGFDDDDNRAAGENIVITRDDGNVVLGGTGKVNAQIGDSEQGAVIMDVTNTYIKGGGAY
jgi:hypothetical protein